MVANTNPIPEAKEPPPEITFDQKMEPSTMRRERPEKTEAVLTTERRLGGGAGARFGVKLSKTDFILPNIPEGVTFSLAAGTA
jgi:hypothetical protein